MAKVKLDIESNFDVLRQAGDNLNKLNNEAAKLGDKMNGSFKQATSGADKFDKEVKNGITSVNKLTKESDSFKSSISNMATGFVAGTVISGGLSKISQAFTDAIQLQKEFEKSIQNLSAITGASGKDLDFYSEQALKLGVTVKGGAVATVEAFKLIGSAKPELLANKEALVQVTESA